MAAGGFQILFRFLFSSGTLLSSNHHVYVWWQRTYSLPLHFIWSYLMHLHCCKEKCTWMSTMRVSFDLIDHSNSWHNDPVLVRIFPQYCYRWQNKYEMHPNKMHLWFSMAPFHGYIPHNKTIQIMWHRKIDFNLCNDLILLLILHKRLSNCAHIKEQNWSLSVHQ